MYPERKNTLPGFFHFRFIHAERVIVKTESGGQPHCQKDLPDLTETDVSLFKQYLTDEAVCHTVQILVELDRHRLMKLGCCDETHFHSHNAETLFKMMVSHWRSFLLFQGCEYPVSSPSPLRDAE